jgi:hypothetical protein
MSAGTLDAVAGDPAAVARAARSMSALAEDVCRQAATLRSIASSPSCWSGRAGAEAQARSATLPPKLDKVTASYGTAGDALFNYAQVLSETQQRSKAAISAAQRASDDLRTARQAQATATIADARAVATAMITYQVVPPPTAPRYAAAIDDAESRLARAAAANAAAHADQQSAASRAASAIKAAARAGIRNQSWWHHVTSSVAHWTSTHWRTTLARVAAFAGKVSMLASIAAVALAIGGLFFPPLEVLAAAAESEALMFGAIAAISATTVELSQRQTRKDGALSLALFAVPPAANGFRRLIPFEAGSVVVPSIVDDANSAAVDAQPHTFPLGFADQGEFVRFGVDMRAGLDAAGYPDTVGIMQGSSVTGVKFTTGRPFDKGRVSDYDVALAGSDLFAAARKLAIPLRGKGTRTGELTSDELIALGLNNLSVALSTAARRPVKFMVYDDATTAVARTSSIRITP